MDLNKQILINLDNYDYIKDVTIKNINNDKIKKKLLYRLIHIIAFNDKIQANNLVDKMKLNVDDKSLVALFIQIYSLNDKIEDALMIYDKIKNKKKRFIIPIYNQLVETDKKEALNFLTNNIYNKFVINEDDVKKIYDLNKDDRILKIMSDNEIILNNISYFKKFFNCKEVEIVNNRCSNCNCRLKKFVLCNEDIQKLKNNMIKKYFNKKNINEINKLNNYLKCNNFNVFIDGNNILFSKNGKINLDSFKKLEIIYKKLSKYNPLIFIHIRHSKYIKNLSEYNKICDIINKLPIYWTPYKMNDDWFFIWAGLTIDNSYIVTNDKLKDHIFEISEETLLNNILSVWMNNVIIRYDTLGDIKIPNDYSFKIQNINNNWHIPSITNWLCMKKN